MEVDRLLIYQEFGEVYLTPYCEKYLKLSGEVAAKFVRVARRAREFPALERATIEGRISLTKAKAIASVLLPQNCESWISKAENLSRSQLEREVANATRGEPMKEKIRPAPGNRIRIQFEITVKEMDRYTRARDLIGARNATYARTLVRIIDFYLHRKDPVKKAARPPRPKSDRPRGRSPKLSAQVRHAVNRRDRGQCQAILPDGTPCLSTRWVHLHHITPKSEGGKDTAAKLTTLCSGHHRQWHKRHSPPRAAARHAGS